MQELKDLKAASGKHREKWILHGGSRLDA
jgi:hypothetical protein